MGILYEILDDILDFGGGGSTHIPRQLLHGAHPIYIDKKKGNGIAPGLLPTEDSGRRLTNCEKCALSRYIPQEDLNNARIHENGLPWYTNIDPNVIGTTRGSDIYFRPGAYNPHTAEGLGLLGHELVHVGQYRNGMTLLSYVLHAGSYEEPAYALGARITDDFRKTGSPC